MKKLKKMSPVVNSAEEMFRNCVCAQVRCACNPTVKDANFIIYEASNRSVTQSSVRATDGPYSW